MALPIIGVERLSKQYLVGHQARRAYHSLREDAMRSMGRAVRRTADLLRGRAIVAGDRIEEFWALRDLSFQIDAGDVLGIIGRNGAGKSTLLKILSRIVEPSAGRVTLRGRVASLLEVGTGFHLELTGRENIFLNGTILGMTRAEIRAKFDEIVAFAEVEPFLDTPVKHYSSGMHVRLAFAVAAHLEPEILVIDEVLAVGDADFQKKCLGKMGDVARGGRTILFVSHQLSAVASLCNKVLYLRQGRLEAFGPTDAITARYLADLQAGRETHAVRRRLAGGALELEACEVSPNPVPSGGALTMRVALRAHQTTTVRDLALLLHQETTGMRVAVVDFRQYGLPAKIAAGERWEIQGDVAHLPFVDGHYDVGLYLDTDKAAEDVSGLLSLGVSPLAAGIPQPAGLAIQRGVVELDFRLASAGSTVER